jgi:predicted PurR-regulated permease PerM
VTDDAPGERSNAPPPSSPSSLSLPSAPRSGHWQRPLFLGVSAAIASTVILLARDVMLPLVLGVLIAYVLTPLVRLVERRRLPRGLAILIVYVVVLGGLGTFLRLIAPRLGTELATFTREVPALTAKVKAEWIPRAQEKLRVVTGVGPPPEVVREDKEESALVVRPRGDGSYAIDVQGGIVVRHLHDGFIIDKARPPEPFDPNRFVADSVQASLAYAQRNAVELVRIGGGIIAGVSRFFFVFGLTLMIAAYMILTRERILSFFVSLVRPSNRDDFGRLIARVDRGLAGVVRGQIIICLINGVLSAIGFWMFDLKYWPVLAVVATIFSLVPIFGSIASAVPAVALGLTQSFSTGALVLVWIIGIHQFEANVLNPKIMGDAAKIHPILVIFSLLVGEHFFHITGALLAVPCMSIAQSVFIHFRQIVQQTDPELAREPLLSVPPPAPRADSAG